MTGLTFVRFCVTTEAIRLVQLIQNPKAVFSAGPAALREKLHNPMKPLLCSLLIAVIGSACSPAPDKLADGFAHPPDSAKPWVYWFWMNGNVTEEGITADLEAMSRVGIGGALIMNVSNGIPAGRVGFMGEKWREMFQHAVSEAQRLGLQINMNNDDGWTGSGGPWITPEQSMQMLTWSDTRIVGPQSFDAILPPPPTRKVKGFGLGTEKAVAAYDKAPSSYRDIAVYAIPSTGPAMGSLAPVVSSSGKAFDANVLVDGNLETGIQLPVTSPDSPPWIQFEFPEPFTAMSLTILTGHGRQNHGGRLESSDDGTNFTPVCKFQIPSNGINPSILGTGFPAVTARYFRIVFDRVSPDSKSVLLQELDLSPDARIENWPGKAGFSRVDGLEPAIDKAGDQAAPQNAILNLTDKMDASGRLRWDAPAGSWTILRIGHASTGKMNHPATPDGTGLECDKLSKEAIEKHFEGVLAKLISDAGPLAGKAFAATHIDSWEVGTQNWTPKFREEFQKRRGYDPMPYVPAMVGVPVVNNEISERFLWDVRRTLADMIADNYVGHLRELAHKNGMQLSVEAYGNGNFDNLQCSARADIPMAEFWAGHPEHAERGKPAASTAHQLGQPVVAAEAFTANPEFGKWQNVPATLKSLGDAAFCSGINRFVFHRWAMQPWMDRLPGMTFGPHGIHFERTETWFEQSRAWLTYLARCQFLLQQGTFVADLCYLTGESAPKSVPSSTDLKPTLPPGRDYDGCSAEMIQNMSVTDGRLVLPSGMSYKLLVLPESRFMTPQLLRKIRDLVLAGAHVVGPKPEKSPGLENFPACDDEVRALADELWGTDSVPPEGRAVGKGRVYSGQPLERILSAMGSLPDVEWKDADNSKDLSWIHRRTPDADIYFMANSRNGAVAADAVFRVSGKLPELWHPDTGKMDPVATWQRTADGRTMVPLRLDQAGSVFVVFRKPADAADPIVKILRDGQPLDNADVPGKLVIKNAAYGILDDPSRTLDVTRQLAARVKDGKLTNRVWCDFGKGDPAPKIPKTLRVEYSFNGRDAVASAKDTVTLTLPPRAPLAEPKAEMKGTDLLAWEPGKYEFTTASGKNSTYQVAEVPRPMEINAPWTLQFPAKWGAPAEITLDKLISWTEYPDEGVKYFSGTATYRKTFDIPADRVGKELYLDLGVVKELAEVVLNGHNLGVLWKPPFRVNITKFAKPGANELEIRVTNLWPNRLIGDEQKPPYLKWNGGSPAEWPDWLVDGGPVPDTGRFTFTTWHHYTKASPLLESGLLGPVTLRAAEKISIGQQGNVHNEKPSGK